jgi:hypothetical protein
MKRIRYDSQAKPRELKPSIKRLIVQRALTQRKTPREILALELINDIRYIGEIPPTLETAKRYISKARNTKNPKDETWTLANSLNYPSIFTPESISVIVDSINRLNELIGEHNQDYIKYFGKPDSYISIRWAIWIVRLKPLIEHISNKLTIENEPLPPGFTEVIASMYSMAEMASEILGEEEFDSADLDRALFAGDLETLSMHAANAYYSSLSPTNCDNNCDSCKRGLIPIFINPKNGAKSCIPKYKEAK